MPPEVLDFVKFVEDRDQDLDGWMEVDGEEIVCAEKYFAQHPLSGCVQFAEENGKFFLSFTGLGESLRRVLGKDDGIRPYDFSVVCDAFKIPYSLAFRASMLLTNVKQLQVVNVHESEITISSNTGTILRVFSDGTLACSPVRDSVKFNEMEMMLWSD